MKPLITVSKPALQEGIPESYHLAGVCAQSCLESKCDELLSGEITYQDLKMIEKHLEKMMQLCVALSRHEEEKPLHKAIEDAVQLRLEEYEVVKNCHQQYDHLVRYVQSANIGKVQGEDIYTYVGHNCNPIIIITKIVCEGD